ncbi:MAG: hypothetical protein IJA88_02215 [Clostridia bacterium]|nr:hypothetical protein [Clostridia bacterium]
MAKEKKPKKEKEKLSREDRKIKKALKCLRFRGLKNFFIWLMGVLIMPFILVVTMVIGLKVVPISTYLGGKEQDYVSENIGNKSIIDAIMQFESYTFDDVAFIDQLIQEIQATDIGEGKTLGEWIEIDTAQLKGTKLTQLASVLQNCIKVNATLDNTVGSDMLADFGEIKAFNEWEEVEEEPDTTAENFNPNLYWYYAEEGVATGGGLSAGGFSTPEGPDTKSGKWELAYELVDGTYQRKHDATTLHYANLSQIPLTMAMDLIDESLSRIKLNELLSIAGIKQEVDPETGEPKPNLILDLFEGKTINDFSGEFKADELLSELTIETLGGAEMLGDLGSLKAFSEYKPVKENPEYGAEGLANIEEDNPKWYYFADGEEYFRAFNDEGKWIDKDGNLNPEAYYSLYYANLSKVSFTDMTALLSETFSVMEITELLAIAGVEKPEEGENLIYSIFEGKTFADLSGQTDASTLLGGVTLNTLGGAEMLGDLGKLDVFGKWAQVDGEIDTTAKDFNHKLYYYVADETKVDSTTGQYADDAFALAFNEDKTLVGGANGKTIYYAKLSAVPFLDMTDLLTESIGRLGVKDLLNNLGGATFESGSLMDKILGDKTVSEMGSIGTEEDPILLSWVLPYDNDSKETYKILISAIGETVPDNDVDLQARAESLSVSDLTLDPNNINLSVIIPETESNEDLYKLLRDALGIEEGEPITVGKLGGGLTVDKITLESVLPRTDGNGNPTNVDLYKILDSAVDKTYLSDGDNSKIEIGELSTLDFDKITLETVLPRTENGVAVNEDLYKILDGILTDSNGDGSIQISELSTGFNLDNLALNTVLPKAENEDLYEILEMLITPADDEKGITVKDLGKELSFNNLKLSVVMKDFDESSTLVKILTKATDKTWGELTVDYLNKFDVSKIYLSDVMTDVSATSSIAKILANATGETWANVTIYHISNNFSLDKLNLTTVMENAPTDMLNILRTGINGNRLSSGYAGANNQTISDNSKLTVGDIADFKIDFVPLSTVLGEGVNQTLKTILMGACGETDFENITFSSLMGSGFNIENVYLKDVLGEDVSDTLKNILNEAFGNYNAVKVSDLKTFKLDNVSLKTAMGDNYNPTLFNILKQATGKQDESAIKISDLKEFSFTNVSLSTVITGTTNNNIIDLLVDDSSVTIGNIGEKINDLTLFDLYGTECFTKNVDEAVNPSIKFVYNEESKTYTHNDNGDYYLHKDDGIWLLLCFDSSEVARTKDPVTGLWTGSGRPEKYTISSLTLNDLATASNITEKFNNATIAQLVDAGMLSNVSEKIMPYTLAEALSLIK